MDDDNKMKEGSLANGLKIAVSISPDSQRRVLQDIQEIRTDGGPYNYEDLRQNGQDNMLTLFKRSKEDGGRKFQLAICVCMYS